MKKDRIIIKRILIGILLFFTVSCGGYNEKEIKKRCGNILLKSVEDKEFRKKHAMDIIHNFIYLNNRKYFSVLMKIYNETTDKIVKAVILNHLGYLPYSKLFLKNVYRNTKNKYFKMASIRALFMMKEYDFDKTDKIEKFLRKHIVRDESFEDFNKNGVIALMALYDYKKLLFGDYLSKRFLHSNKEREFATISFVCSKHKARFYNDMVLKRLKKYLHKDEITSYFLMKPISGEDKATIEYLKKIVSNKKNKNFRSALMAISGFKSGKNIALNYFKNIKSDYYRASIAKNERLLKIATKEERKILIEFLLKYIKKEKYDYTSSSRIINLLKYEKDFPEITDAVHSFFETKHMGSIFEIMDKRGLKKNEIKYITFLLDDKRVWVKFKAARHILNALYKK